MNYTVLMFCDVYEMVYLPNKLVISDKLRELVKGVVKYVILTLLSTCADRVSFVFK